MTRQLWVVIGFLIAFAGAFYVGKDYGADQVRLDNHERHEAAQLRAREAEGKIDQLLGELLEVKNRKPKTVEVLKYVANNECSSDSRLALGIVGVFNERLGYEFGSRENPDWPEADRAQLSTLTFGAFLQWTEGLADRYRVLRLDHNALVEAVEIAESP